MNLFGIGTSAYPALGYGYTYKSSSRNVSRTEFGSCAETVQRSEMAGGTFVLHYFDNEDGERTVGATCGRDYSASVYIPKDFDPNNPIYKVKVWDKDGSVTERMVDLTKVDPESSDFIDMYAYSCYLECSGKCPGAQSAFMGSAGYSFGMDGMHYDDLFEQRSWMDNLKEMMEMQYSAGNLEGYLGYKKLWDFLNVVGDCLTKDR